MKTVKVRIHCSMCGNFRIEHDADTNEHGYFVFPEAHCPECLGILQVDVDELPKDIT